MNGDCRAFGCIVPPDMLGELVDVSALLPNPERLRERLVSDGHALLRGVLDEGEVIAAREAVFERLQEAGEIGGPARAGIATGASRRREVACDLGRVMEVVWGEPACGMDYIFLRAGAPGSATGLHYDFPFFTRATPLMYTVWVPIGPVPVTAGPLVVVEGSRRFDDIPGHLDGFDIELDDTRKAEVSHDPVAFATERGCRLLTTDFAAGDILIFDMFTMHGSLDNHSPIGRVRLSCDVRYQPVADPFDPRYFGPDPGGTFGGGYGELNGAKPLDEPWPPALTASRATGERLGTNCTGGESAAPAARYVGLGSNSARNPSTSRHSSGLRARASSRTIRSCLASISAL